jgi:teichoic acid transport system ATP-binding protein
MKNIAIKVKNLTKVYHLYDKPQDRLKEALNPFKKSYHHDFYALNNINFEVKRGEILGIIGKNGSGKSTLLKMITGVLTQTSGNIEVNGKISAILELGAGFNPEMNGIENIYLNSSINGLSKEEVDNKIDEIIDFSELGEFIYQPIKTYSSGMKARLSFAVAINIDPEILIVDEALSVGDVRFQQKCLRKMEEFKKQNKTILFVSHSTGMIERFCDRAIWLHEGIVKEKGSSELISKKYYSFMAYGLEMVENKKELSSIGKATSSSIKWNSLEGYESFGKGGVKIIGVSLIDCKSNLVSIVQGNETIKVVLKLNVLKELYSPIVGFIVKDKTGVSIMGANSYTMKQCKNILLDTKGIHIIELSFKMPCIKNGEYTISPAIAEGTQDNHIQHHWIHDAIIFKVQSSEEDARHSWIVRTDKMNIKMIKE